MPVIYHEGGRKARPKGISFEYQQRKRVPIIKDNPDSRRNDPHIVDLLPVDVSFESYPPTNEPVRWSDNMKGNYNGGNRKRAHLVSPMSFDEGGRSKKEAWHVGLPFVGYHYRSGKFYFINQNRTYVSEEMPSIPSTDMP